MVAAQTRLGRADPWQYRKTRFGGFFYGRIKHEIIIMAYSYWLEAANCLQERADDVFSVGFHNLDEDFDIFRGEPGLPAEVCMPVDAS
jgi:hypothetical protein